MSTSGVILSGRYELHRRIGAGGYSEVWRATDLVLGRMVAVKLLYAGFAEHAETRTRFRAEGRRAGQLSHENIARVYDFCEPPDPDLPFLVMELIDGPSVADLLRSGPLEQASTARIIAQTAAGLDAAHQAGLIHRDIKPANLLISPGGVVKITDFGISDAADSAPITAANLLIGTPAYLAPERVTGVRATQATDLYALGIVGYECLTGSLPFDGHGMQVAMAHRERPLPPLPESVDPDLAALIADLAAKDPGARPFSAADVACRAGQIADRMEAEAGALAAPAARAPEAAPASETVPDVAAAPEPEAAPASRTAPMPLTEDVPVPPPAWRWPSRRVMLAAAARGAGHRRGDHRERPRLPGVAAGHGRPVVTSAPGGHRCRHGRGQQQGADRAAGQPGRAAAQPAGPQSPCGLEGELSPGSRPGGGRPAHGTAPVRQPRDRDRGRPVGCRQPARRQPDLRPREGPRQRQRRKRERERLGALGYRLVGQAYAARAA